MHVSETYKDGGSDGSGTEHEVTNMKDLKTIDFKDSLAKTYIYSDFLAVSNQNKDGGSRGSETEHTNVNDAEKAAAQMAAASEGKRNIRTIKMELLSFETKNPVIPVHSTEVPETTLMHALETYEDGGSDGSEAEHEATDTKDQKTIDFKDLLPKTSTCSELLAVSERNKDGGSVKPETEHTSCSARKDILCLRFKVHTNVNSAEMVAAAKTAA